MEKLRFLETKQTLRMVFRVLFFITGSMCKSHEPWGGGRESPLYAVLVGKSGFGDRPHLRGKAQQCPKA